MYSSAALIIAHKFASEWVSIKIYELMLLMRFHVARFWSVYSVSASCDSMSFKKPSKSFTSASRDIAERKIWKSSFSHETVMFTSIFFILMLWSHSRQWYQNDQLIQQISDNQISWSSFVQWAYFTVYLRYTTSFKSWPHAVISKCHNLWLSESLCCLWLQKQESSWYLSSLRQWSLIQLILLNNLHNICRQQNLKWSCESCWFIDQ